MSRDLQRQLHEISLACIHCGLCLPECPTYLTLENEMDSPRGRIYLMRRLVEERVAPRGPLLRHLDLCLGCRGCESVCPSSVRYGELLERTRARLYGSGPRRRRPWSARLIERFVYDVLPFPARLRAAMRLARAARAIGLLRWARGSHALRRLAPELARAAELLPDEAFPSPADPRAGASPPLARPRARVWLFAGCATSALTPRTNANALRLLRHHDCDVHCPPAQTCCGAIHCHGGRLDAARAFARANLAAFARADGPIVSTAAGCGAMLKHYPELLADEPAHAERARRFADRVRDVSELLVELGLRPPPRTLPLRVTYHDACHHAHAQGIRRPPRELLAAIPGLTLLACEDSEHCCGAAGSYNLTEPAVSEELGRRKLARLEASGAQLAATGNVGCILHLNATALRVGSPLRVVHTVDLLARAYGLDAPHTADGHAEHREGPDEPRRDPAD